MRISLRSFFSLTFLIAVALVGILSFRESFRLESLRITREEELAHLEDLKRELMPMEQTAKYDAAIDRLLALYRRSTKQFTRAVKRHFPFDNCLPIPIRKGRQLPFVFRLMCPAVRRSI
jgi:hypothetical protein